MPKVVVRGETVYQCTVCKRRTRVPSNRKGLDVINNCIITSGCKGTLNRLSTAKEINNTPTLTPNSPGLLDWYQNKLLYTHTQVVSSNKWEVSHMLNNKPISNVFVTKSVDGVNQLIPIIPKSIETVDSNNTIINFDRAYTGVAQLITLASQNVTNPTQPISTLAGNNIQYSNDLGTITIATLAADPIITVNITYVISGQSPVSIRYTDIDNTPSSSSPWAGVSRVVIEGKTYVVRSIDLISHPAAIGYFLSGQIPPQGSALYVSDIDYTVPTDKSIILLGAVSPYGVVDRIYDQYANLSAETSTSGNIGYSYGKLYASEKSIKNIFPFITVV